MSIFGRFGIGGRRWMRMRMNRVSRLACPRSLILEFRYTPCSRLLPPSRLRLPYPATLTHIRGTYIVVSCLCTNISFDSALGKGVRLFYLDSLSDYPPLLEYAFCVLLKTLYNECIIFLKLEKHQVQVNF